MGHRMTLCVVQLSSACPERVQREYKQRQDGVATASHWDLCRQHGFDRSQKWYGVEDNKNFKLRLDFRIQTDRKLDHNRLDIVDRTSIVSSLMLHALVT